MAERVQDLSRAKVPPGFRGRAAWFVQLWWIVEALLFHPSPQVLYGWRRFLLRAFGARIGKGVLIRPSVTVTYPWKLSIGDWSWVGDRVTLYTLGEISIGESSVVSQGTYLCTGSHDYYAHRVRHLRAADPCGIGVMDCYQRVCWPGGHGRTRRCCGSLQRGAQGCSIDDDLRGKPAQGTAGEANLKWIN